MSGLAFCLYRLRGTSRLEEIELDPQEKYWLVTVGFFLPEKTETTFSILSQQSSKPIRAYKLIKVDAKTGQPISMKIRQV